MPETAPAPAAVPVQGQATVPLASFIRPFQRHYFSGHPERPTTGHAATTSPESPP
ncbi:hypothetical protein GCM10028793_19020 [Nocardiopsis oceani]